MCPLTEEKVFLHNLHVKIKQCNIMPSLDLWSSSVFLSPQTMLNQDSGHQLSCNHLWNVFRHTNKIFAISHDSDSDELTFFWSIVSPQLHTELCPLHLSIGIICSLNLGVPSLDITGLGGHFCCKWTKLKTICIWKDNVYLVRLRLEEGDKISMSKLLLEKRYSSGIFGARREGSTWFQ